MEKLKFQNKKTPKNGQQKGIAFNSPLNSKSPYKSLKNKKSNFNSASNKSETEINDEIIDENFNEISNYSSSNNFENEEEEDFEEKQYKQGLGTGEEKEIRLKEDCENKYGKKFSGKKREKNIEANNSEANDNDNNNNNNDNTKFYFEKERGLNKKSNEKQKNSYYNKAFSSFNSTISKNGYSKVNKIINEENNFEINTDKDSSHDSVGSFNRKINLNKTNKAFNLSIDQSPNPAKFQEHLEERKKSPKSIKKKLIAVNNFSSNFIKKLNAKEALKKGEDDKPNKLTDNNNNSNKYNNKNSKNLKPVKIENTKSFSAKKAKSRIVTANRENSNSNITANYNVEETIKNYNAYTSDYLFEFRYLEKNKRIFNWLPPSGNSVTNSYSFLNDKIPVTGSPVKSYLNIQLNKDKDEKTDLNDTANNNSDLNCGVNTNVSNSPLKNSKTPNQTYLTSSPNNANLNLNLYANSSLNNALNNSDENSSKETYYIKSLFKSKAESLFVLNLNNSIFKNHYYETYYRNLTQFQAFFIQKLISDPNQIIHVKAYKDAPKCLLVPVEHSGSKFSKNIKKCNLIWKLYKFEKMVSLIKTLSPNQKYNHFPKTFQLGRKDNLWKNFKKFKRKHPLEYNYHPQAFIIPEELSEFKHFAKTNPSFAWIIKPLASSRGRGIRLLTSFEDIPKECLICRYVEKPHLILNKKYDLRIYVLITSFTPLKIFLFKDGLVRFASEEYTKGNKENIFIHLTNYAVNKKNKNYDKTDDDGSGSKWTLAAYEKYFLENNMHEKFQFIWERVKDIIIKTIISAAEESANYSKVYSKHENVLFELYGFDIIVDSDFNPWLLEVNVNPSLNCDSELDYNVKTNLITDIINIIGLRPLEVESSECNGNAGNSGLRKSVATMANDANANSNSSGSKNARSNSNINHKENSKPKNKSSFNRNYNIIEGESNKNLNSNYSPKTNANHNYNLNTNFLPVINKSNPNSNSNSNNNFNFYNSIGSGQSPSISQVRIENKRNFMSEEPDYSFNYSEDIVKNYYQSFLKTYEDEYFRSKFSNFDCIFPLSFNCKNYIKFFKSYDDESIVLWKWILSKKPVDKFD